VRIAEFQFDWHLEKKKFPRFAKLNLFRMPSVPVSMYYKFISEFPVVVI